MTNPLRPVPPFLAFEPFNTDITTNWTVLGGGSPRYFNSMVARRGDLEFDTFPTTVNTFNSDPFVVDHGLIYRSLGVTDEVEVGVIWECPDQRSLLHQVSPLAFFDPNATATQQGLVPIWDISLSAFFIQTAFKQPVANTFDYTKFKILGSDGTLRLPQSSHPNGTFHLNGLSLLNYGRGAYNKIVMKCTNNTIEMLVNDVSVVGPMSVPVEFRGRDAWGVHAIFINSSPTEIRSLTGTTDYQNSLKVGCWWAKSL